MNRLRIGKTYRQFSKDRDDAFFVELHDTRTGDLVATVYGRTAAIAETRATRITQTYEQSDV
jgi:hypothetical protein